MAKLDKRKVRVHRLHGYAYRGNIYSRMTYYSLRIGNYSYVLTDKYELVKLSGIRVSKGLLYNPVRATYGCTPYWFAFEIHLDKVKMAEEILKDRNKAMLLSREEGLEAICAIKLKYFADKEVEFKTW